jgi:hypothetical protein
MGQVFDVFPSISHNSHKVVLIILRKVKGMNEFWHIK